LFVFLFPEGFANKISPCGATGRVPGKKSIRLAPKGGGSSFPEAGFRRFRPADKKAGLNSQRIWR
jgi:hypothetical protein